MQESLLAVLLILAVGWLVMRIRRGRKEVREASQPRDRTDQTRRFHAVSIKYSVGSCEAARELAGKRILATEAPRLPLPGCDSDDCLCQFAHHKDRRSGGDRRSPFGTAGHASTISGRFREERRKTPDRRQSD